VPCRLAGASSHPLSRQPVRSLCGMGAPMYDQLHKFNSDQQHRERHGIVFKPMPTIGKHDVPSFSTPIFLVADDRWPRQAILDTGPSPVRWPARLCLRCVDGRQWGKSSNLISLGRCKSGARSSPGTASKASRWFSQNSERRHQRSLRTVRMSYGGSSDQYLPLARQLMALQPDVIVAVTAPVSLPPFQ
jgi:hypothetical protein